MYFKYFTKMQTYKPNTYHDLIFIASRLPLDAFIGFYYGCFRQLEDVDKELEVHRQTERLLNEKVRLTLFLIYLRTEFFSTGM
jgi:hypothetical protein